MSNTIQHNTVPLDRLERAQRSHDFTSDNESEQNQKRRFHGWEAYNTIQYNTNYRSAAKQNEGLFLPTVPLKLVCVSQPENESFLFGRNSQLFILVERSVDWFIHSTLVEYDCVYGCMYTNGVYKTTLPSFLPSFLWMEDSVFPFRFENCSCSPLGCGRAIDILLWIID